MAAKPPNAAVDKMHCVNVFNSQLASLYESKPPVSKAKMMQITVAAMKAIKYYKHVVMSVEKFIQKCKPEYKIPGLYVIDAIVRQSRHQFSPEKDVFGPRFAKNFFTTFPFLANVSSSDKERITKVLNLWLKNDVFTETTIIPLFDLLDTPAAGAQRPDQSEGGPSNDDDVQHVMSVPGSHQASHSSPVKKSAHEGPTPNTHHHHHHHSSEQQTGQHQPVIIPSGTPPLQAGIPLNQPDDGLHFTDGSSQPSEYPQPPSHHVSGSNPPICEQNGPETDFSKKILSQECEYSDDESPVAFDTRKGGTGDSTGKQSTQQLAAAAQTLLKNTDILEQIQRMQQHFQRQKEQAAAAEKLDKEAKQHDVPHKEHSSHRHHHHHHHHQPDSSHRDRHSDHHSNGSDHSQNFEQEEGEAVSYSAHRMSPDIPPPVPIVTSMHLQPPPPVPPPGHEAEEPGLQSPPAPVPPPSFVGGRLVIGDPFRPPLPPMPPSDDTTNNAGMEYDFGSAPPPPPAAVPDGGDIDERIGQPDSDDNHSKRHRKSEKHHRSKEKKKKRSRSRSRSRDKEKRSERQRHKRSSRSNTPSRAEKKHRRDRDRDNNSRTKSPARDAGGRDGDEPHTKKSKKSKSATSDRDKDRRKQGIPPVKHGFVTGHRRDRDRDNNSRTKSPARDAGGRDGDEPHTKKSKKSKSATSDRDKDRRKQGIPPLKHGFVTVCSRTLWFGRVPSFCDDDDMKAALADFGIPVSIDLIPPRGCAYVVMPDRKSAFRVLERSKELKINNKVLKKAWAPGKGVKDEAFRQHWDETNGVTLIPWNSIPENLFDLLDGGTMDQESLPEFLKAQINQLDQSSGGELKSPNPEPILAPDNSTQNMEVSNQTSSGNEETHPQPNMMPVPPMPPNMMSMPPPGFMPPLPPSHGGPPSFGFPRPHMQGYPMGPGLNFGRGMPMNMPPPPGGFPRPPMFPPLPPRPPGNQMSQQDDDNISGDGRNQGNGTEILQDSPDTFPPQPVAPPNMNPNRNKDRDAHEFGEPAFDPADTYAQTGPPRRFQGRLPWERGGPDEAGPPGTAAAAEEFSNYGAPYHDPSSYGDQVEDFNNHGISESKNNKNNDNSRHMNDFSGNDAYDIRRMSNSQQVNAYGRGGGGGRRDQHGLQRDDDSPLGMDRDNRRYERGSEPRSGKLGFSGDRGGPPPSRFGGSRSPERFGATRGPDRDEFNRKHPFSPETRESSDGPGFGRGHRFRGGTDDRSNRADFNRGGNSRFGGGPGRGSERDWPMNDNNMERPQNNGDQPPASLRELWIHGDRGGLNGGARNRFGSHGMQDNEPSVRESGDGPEGMSKHPAPVPRPTFDRNSNTLIRDFRRPNARESDNSRSRSRDKSVDQDSYGDYRQSINEPPSQQRGGGHRFGDKPKVEWPRRSDPSSNSLNPPEEEKENPPGEEKEVEKQSPVVEKPGSPKPVAKPIDVGKEVQKTSDKAWDATDPSSDEPPDGDGNTSMMEKPGAINEVASSSAENIPSDKVDNEPGDEAEKSEDKSKDDTTPDEVLEGSPEKQCSDEQPAGEEPTGEQQSGQKPGVLFEKQEEGNADTKMDKDSLVGDEQGKDGSSPVAGKKPMPSVLAEEDEMTSLREKLGMPSVFGSVPSIAPHSSRGRGGMLLGGGGPTVGSLLSTPGQSFLSAVATPRQRPPWERNRSLRGDNVGSGSSNGISNRFESPMMVRATLQGLHNELGLHQQQGNQKALQQQRLLEQEQRQALLQRQLQQQILLGQQQERFAGRGGMIRRGGPGIFNRGGGIFNRGGGNNPFLGGMMNRPRF